MILSSGAIALWFQKWTLTIVINVIWCIYGALKVRCLKFTQKQIITILVILLTLLFQFCMLGIKNYAVSGTLHIISVVIMLIIVIQMFSFESIMEAFSDIMTVLAVTSLIIFMMIPVILQYRNVLPQLQLVNNEYTSRYTNLYISLIRWEGSQRNCSVFWEPGAYQIFLNIALWYEMFCKKKRRVNMRMVVFFITIATTISTAGMINAILLAISYVSVNNKKGTRKNMILLLLLSLIIGISFLPEFISSIQYKLGIETGVMSSNVTSRIQPFLLDLEIIREFPLGVGADRYGMILAEKKMENGFVFESTSCTPTIIGASFGIVILFLMICSFVKLGCIGTEKKTARMVLFAFWMILFSTESFLLYPLFYFFMLIGLLGKRGKIRNE